MLQVEARALHIAPVDACEKSTSGFLECDFIQFNHQQTHFAQSHVCDDCVAPLCHITSHNIENSLFDCYDLVLNLSIQQIIVVCH
jgi:hypothetical protein